MYTVKEIETIFRHCKNVDEIYQALSALLWVKADGDINFNMQIFIGQRSRLRLQELKTV